MNKTMEKLCSDINKCVNGNIDCHEWHSSIVLEGSLDNWGDVVKAGKIAAGRGYKGVVNRITAKGTDSEYEKSPQIVDRSLEGRHTDVLVIGAGIIGCSIARELSKWNVSILVVDKEDDVAVQASSRNDGMVHPGIEPKTGSRKAIYNVKGNKLYSRITQELDVPFRRSGSIILFGKRWMKALGPLFLRRARLNGVEGVKLLSREEVKKREPYVKDDIAGGVYLSSTGVLSPYKMTIAYAENAVMNGAQISLNTKVISMEKNGDTIISVLTNRGTVYPKAVVNAAGVFADKIADMAGDQFFTIHPRKGEVVFLDKKRGCFLNSVVAMPDLKTIGSETKGGGLVRTIDDNILVGPDAYEQPYKEDYTTNYMNIDRIIKKHMPIIPTLSPADVITYCSGIRASTYEEDFIIERSDYVKNLVHAAGIQSPGLASAPAIAEEIERITCCVLSQVMEVRHKDNWNPYRKGIPELHRMGKDERNALIKLRPDYGIIVCRCEEISMGEIKDAIHSPIPVSSVDGVKRRIRSGMGRCQGSFCLPHVMEIIHNETSLPMTMIKKKGSNSNILVDETKKPQGGSIDGHI